MDCSHKGGMKETNKQEGLMDMLDNNSIYWLQIVTVMKIGGFVHTIYKW